jgi:hypothetical protein
MLKGPRDEELTRARQQIFPEQIRALSSVSSQKPNLRKVDGVENPKIVFFDYFLRPNIDVA